MEQEKETKTIKNVAQDLGISPAAVKRTLTRWTDHPEKKSLFTAGQKSFVKNIKPGSEWPEWLVTIWCDNYQPRASNGGSAPKVVNLPTRQVPTVAVKIMEGKTARVFAGVGDYPTTNYEANIQALREEIRQKNVELQDLRQSKDDVSVQNDDLLLKLEQIRQKMAELDKENQELFNLIGIEKKTVDQLIGDIESVQNKYDLSLEKLLAYESDTWRSRITNASQYALTDYLIPKVALLAFQSYIYAIYVMRVFAFLNTKIASRPDIAETYRDNVLHHPWFYGMWVIGFFVDGAGFAIAAKLSEPKYLSDGDARLTWIGWFFVLQILIDLCYLFGTFNQYIEWFGAVIVVVAPALAIMAYARSSFKKGQA